MRIAREIMRTWELPIKLCLHSISATIVKFYLSIVILEIKNNCLLAIKLKC